MVDSYTLDIYYVTHFPLTEKYIALYPKSEIESQDVLDKRERIRLRLREEMLNGKPRVTGSNRVQIGGRRLVAEDKDDASFDDDNDVEEDIGAESSEHQDSEDEFLDLRRRK